ncbi:ABATE domain-containing protein [Streptomyces sp. NPDC007162]|uniref:ABATE domain-containing protein n=1 Tax=Streptomyces sp. NPDC007162 TaxID=3156917 RepID=UPI00340F2F35
MERLATPARLAEWLEHCELSPARTPDQADLEKSRRLREILRALALATVDERTPPADDVADLAAFLAAHDEPIDLTAADRLRRRPPATTLHALALRSCPEHDCKGVFIDPPGRRRVPPQPGAESGPCAPAAAPAQPRRTRQADWECHDHEYQVEVPCEGTPDGREHRSPDQGPVPVQSWRTLGGRGGAGGPRGVAARNVRPSSPGVAAVSGRGLAGGDPRPGASPRWQVSAGLAEQESRGHALRG